MKFLIILFLSSYLCANFIDLGIDGPQYDIKETDFLKTMENGLNDINYTKIESDFKKSLDKQLHGENNLPVCKEDYQFKDKDYIVLKQDIYKPSGDVYKKKGEKIYTPIPKPLNICFIDGTNSILIKNQMDYFDELTNHSCIYHVSKTNIMDLYEKYPLRQRDIYPTKSGYEERFNVKCLPTLIHLNQNDRYRIELNINQFKHQRGK
jgi:hypothetical protein